MNFVRNDDDFSIEGTTNNDGIYIRNGVLHFYRHTSVAIKPARKKDDKYYTEALQNRIKYCCLLSRTIRVKKRYYVHVLLESTTPNCRVYGDSRIELLDVKISHLEMQIDGKKEVIELLRDARIRKQGSLRLKERWMFQGVSAILAITVRIKQ